MLMLAYAAQYRYLLKNAWYLKYRLNFFTVFKNTISKTDVKAVFSNRSNHTSSVQSHADEIELEMTLNASCLRLEVSLPAQLLLFVRRFCNSSEVEQVTGGLLTDRLYVMAYNAVNLYF